MKNIALLGSTGSIGRQVLDCVRRYPDRYRIVSLAAASNSGLLNLQINEFKPNLAAIRDKEAAEKLVIPKGVTLFSGEDALENAVLNEADIVFVAVVGFAGLKGVLKAIELGKTVALANKEALVAGGEIVTRLAKEKGVEILPVDSEHSALWQSMSFDKAAKFKRLIITASGGAFRNVPLEQLSGLKAAEALKHPNWNMGKKITVDCATMVNKGLEVIEAKWLFDCPLEKIRVLYHPESIVHSMVEYDDGAIMAQMGFPSMELPISLALSYPERLCGAPTIDLAGKILHFDELDKRRYPCFDLVLESAKAGGVYPCALSSANEEAVKLYLEDRIKFTDIYSALSFVCDGIEGEKVTVESLSRADSSARALVKKWYETRI